MAREAKIFGNLCPKTAGNIMSPWCSGVHCTIIHCTVLHTVCSVALACRSHISTSLLFFAPTHSWALSCPAHWRWYHATSQLAQHMDWQPYWTLEDKEQELPKHIAGYELTAAKAADRTALHFNARQTGASGGQGWGIIYIFIHVCHFKPCSVISRYF